MQVESAIILSAGKGTRMGDLGQFKAKPVWPFFGETLIELHIKFLSERFGIKKFYINSHHLHEQLNFLESDNVHIVYEPELLDQGGGVLNILSKYSLWNEAILVSNSDQLFFFDEIYFEQAKKKIINANAVLFALDVNKDEGYNKLLVADNKLKEIKKNADVQDEEFMTYSGISLIKCLKTNYNNEALSFFTSVADFQNKEVLVQPTNSSDYYDFGKLTNFYNLCMSTKKKLENGKNDFMTNILSSRAKNFIGLENGLNFSLDPSLRVPVGVIAFDEGRIYLEDDVVKEEVKARK